VLGLRGSSFQSLYHFTVGTPLEDARLTTAPGYAWEGATMLERGSSGHLASAINIERPNRR
jgi:hypothetical protein